MLINVGLGYFINVSAMLILDQSVMFILYPINGLVKNYEIFMVKTRLTYLSSPTGITSLFVRVCEYVRFNLLYLRRLRTRAEPDYLQFWSCYCRNQ